MKNGLVHLNTYMLPKSTHRFYVLFFCKKSPYVITVNGCMMLHVMMCCNIILHLYFLISLIIMNKNTVSLTYIDFWIFYENSTAFQSLQRVVLTNISFPFWMTSAYVADEHIEIMYQNTHVINSTFTDNHCDVFTKGWRGRPPGIFSFAPLLVHGLYLRCWNFPLILCECVWSSGSIE